jgi:hypothetical protein
MKKFRISAMLALIVFPSSLEGLPTRYGGLFSTILRIARTPFQGLFQIAVRAILPPLEGILL